MLREKKIERIKMANTVAKYFASDEENYEMESRYIDAAASFEDDIRRMGLAETAVSCFNRGKQGDKYNLIPHAIISIVENQNKMAEEKENIYSYFYDNQQNMRYIKKVKQALYAFKYATRSYHKIDNINEEE